MKLPQDLFAVPFRMQPGLKRIASGALQFTPIAPGDTAFAEKLAVLSDAAQDGLLITPGFNSLPALTRALDVLVHEHPQHAQRSDTHWLLPRINLRVNRTTGECHVHSGAVPVSSQINQCIQLAQGTPVHAAWVALALSVLEDMAVLHAPLGELKVLAVCLPSHWAPAEKIGKPFVQVHAPVADNALLMQAAQGLMRLVTAQSDERWERYVWTLSPSLLLDGHPKRCHREWSAVEDAREFLHSVAFRLERQTFIALPEQQQAIFTIGVHTAPLLEALNKEELVQLRDSIASMSEAVLEYRSFTTARDKLLRGLELERAYTVNRIIV